MKLKTTLCSLAATTVLAFGGCVPEREYVTATVVKEAGTIVERLATIEPSEGATFGNDSVRFAKPTYVLQLKLEGDENIYTMGVSGGDTDEKEK